MFLKVQPLPYYFLIYFLMTILWLLLIMMLLIMRMIKLPIQLGKKMNNVLLDFEKILASCQNDSLKSIWKETLKNFTLCYVKTINSLWKNRIWLHQIVVKNPRVPFSKLLRGFKVDSAFYHSEVDQMCRDQGTYW